MNNETLPWDEDALKRLEKIPSFVRVKVKKKIEKTAKEAGENKVSAEFMTANKEKMMG